jgi:hypothetical protein
VSEHPTEGSPVKIHVQVSPLASGRLTRGDIRQVVRKAQEEAEFQPDWGSGKKYRFPFKKAGQDYVAALDHRGDELHVFVGLRQEVPGGPDPGELEDDERPAVPGEGRAAGDVKPMTVDQLIAGLEAIRRRHGGDLPVVTADGGPVVRAGVWDGTELAPGPWVVLTDRPEDG